jgi:hypothetical protein
MVYTTFEWKPYTANTEFPLNLQAFYTHLRDAVVPLVIKELGGTETSATLVTQIVYIMQSIESLQKILPAAVPVNNTTVNWQLLSTEMTSMSSSHIQAEHTPKTVPHIVKLLLKALNQLTPMNPLAADDTETSKVIRSVLDVTSGMMDTHTLSTFLSPCDVELLGGLVAHNLDIHHHVSDALDAFNLTCSTVCEKLYMFTLDTTFAKSRAFVNARLLMVMTQLRSIPVAECDKEVVHEVCATAIEDRAINLVRRWQKTQRKC